MNDEVNIESTVLPYSVKPKGNNISFIIPECCKLFADGDNKDIDCPHVVKEQRKVKINIGL